MLSSADSIQRPASASRRFGETLMTGHIGRAAANANGEDDVVDVQHAILIVTFNRDLLLVLVRLRHFALGTDDLGVGPVVDLIMSNT